MVHQARSSSTPSAIPTGDLERHVAALRQDVEGLNRLATLGLFTSYLAHEFNNILTPVMAYAHAAQAHPQDHELAARCVQRALEASMLASAISGTILGLAKGQTEQSSTSIRDAVDDAVQMLSPGQVKVHVDSLHGCVRMSRPALCQVTFNLLKNAVRAVRQQRGGVVTVRSTPWRGQVPAHWLRPRSTWNPGDGPLTAISISDDGPGLSDRVRERLFEDFNSDHPSGSGLGLGFCARVIQSVGGGIFCDSNRGGTTFTILLPACEQTTNTTAPESGSRRSPAGKAPAP